MKKNLRVFFLSLILIGGVIGSASAMQYSATITVFDDSFNLTGQTQTLILVFGLPGQATFSLEVDTADIGEVTFFLNEDKIKVTAEADILGITTLDKNVPLSDDLLSNVTFDYIADKEFLTITNFNFRNDLLVFKRTINSNESEYWTLNIHTPEPSTLILLGLGLISLIGIVRWKNRT